MIEYVRMERKILHIQITSKYSRISLSKVEREKKKLLEIV